MPERLVIFGSVVAALLPAVQALLGHRVVIGAFPTSGILFMKMIVVGMLIALLLDATIVGLVLVPAARKVMNRANWWAPGPLRRWWERYGVREAPALQE